MTTLNISTATTAELVDFFNANTGGAPVKKFADRKTAERRVSALIAEMIEDGDAPDAETTVRIEPADEGSSVWAYAVHGQTHCPGCGVHLSNGVGEDEQEVNGSLIKHDAFQYECLGCGHEFGPAVVRRARKPRPPATGAARPEMTLSLKLDRAIQEVTTGHIYANACRVWKAGLVSSSQCDRLSAVLYGAAKAGNRLMSVTVNGHVFTLANK